MYAASGRARNGQNLCQKGFLQSQLPSHETVRLGRADGASRVGSPPGWCRRRLLRQIGDQLVAGVEQFLFVDDVVAVEDGAGLVAGQEHGNPLGDAGADQVAGSGAPAVVEEAGRHAGRLAGGAPRRAPAPDGDAVAVEDQRAVGVAARPPSRQGLGNRVRDWENPPHQGLRTGEREPDDAAGLVKFVPGEAEDLMLAPARVVGEIEPLSGRHWELDQVPAVGDPTDIVQLGSGAMQRCLNLGFSERIGNSRRTAARRRPAPPSCA